MLSLVKLSDCKKMESYYSRLPLPRWYVKQLEAGSYLGLQITTKPLSDLLQFGPIQRMRRAGQAPISDIILKFQFTYHPWSAAIQLSEHPAMHNRENAAKIAAISSFAAKIEICPALLLICRQPSETTLFIGPRSDRRLRMSLTNWLTDSRPCWRMNVMT